MNALKKMECPHLIQPHQIHGLDFPNIFPVVQWLVKAVLSSQQETASISQKQADLHYYKNIAQKNPTQIKNLHDLYKPKRQFKTNSTTKLNDPIRVYSALLEYGDKTAGASYEQYLRSTKRSTEKSLEESQQQTNLFEKTEEEETNPLLESTEKVVIKSTAAVSGKNLAKIVKAKDIGDARNEYLENKKEDDPEILQRKLEKERIERTIQTLTKQIESKLENKGKLLNDCTVATNHLKSEEAKLQEAKELNEKLISSISTLETNIQEAKKQIGDDKFDLVVSKVEEVSSLKRQQKKVRLT